MFSQSDSSHPRFPPGAAVYIVDDDREVRSSLVLLLRSLRVVARPFATAEDLLEELEFLEPGCLLVDLRMPRMSGIELLEAMRDRNCFWPAVVISGHGEIPLAVQAVKLGAVEFLQKPFTEAELLPALGEGFANLENAVERSRQSQVSQRALEKLSAREVQVFERVVVGRTSKEIARELELSPRTVESYRLTMMHKLGAERLHDLLSLAGRSGPRR